MTAKSSSLFGLALGSDAAGVRSLRFLLALGVAIGIGGCVGSIGGDPKGGEPAPNVEGLEHTCTEERAGLRGTSIDNMRRLSRRELERTLRDLLGAEVASDPEIATYVAGLPSDETVGAGDLTETPPKTLARTLSLIAKRGAEVALTRPGWRATHLGSCADEAEISQACVEQIVRSFGSRVYRRDLDDAEVAHYVEGHTVFGGGEEALAFTLRRLLQAPSLVFHVEQGSEVVDGRLRLTSFEVASRISYSTTDTMPDETLMEAARRGDLETLDGVMAQVERLIVTEGASEKRQDFFRYYAQLGTLPDPLAAPAAYVGIDDPTGLGEEMRQEAFDYFNYIWSNGGGFAELMSSTAAFPRTPHLATVLGSEIANGTEPTSAPSHVGLLHRPALLATPRLRTSPILRGAHVRKLFLCDELPMPDMAAVAARQEELGDIESMSNRDKATLLTSAEACAGCHGFINPVGFAFEGFDPLGVPRANEVVLDESGEVVAMWPLDTTVSNLTLDDDDDPSTVASSAELATEMADSDSARACITRRLFEYYRLSKADDEADACTLAEAEIASVDQSLERVLVATIANEDVFWRAEP